MLALATVQHKVDKFKSLMIKLQLAPAAGDRQSGEELELK